MGSCPDSRYIYANEQLREISELFVFCLAIASIVCYYDFGTITNGRRLSLSLRREHFFSLQSVRGGGMHDGYI